MTHRSGTCSFSATMTSMPTKKEVVMLLMTAKADVTRDVDGRSGSIARKHVPHLVFSCPYGNRCRSGGDVVFEKGTGFTNPYKHLRSCISDGDDEHLTKLYFDALQQKRREGLSNPCYDIPIRTTATKRERDMYSYMRIVVLKSLPVSSVWDDEFRSFSSCESKFGEKYFKEVLYKLTELVEGEIARDMCGKKGAIVHDAWTKNGMHFLVRLTKRDETTVSSMNEATEFDTATHINHLDEVFGFFKQDVREWTVCSIADNCAVNKCIARGLRVPHVGCISHKLNLDVNSMVKDMHDLANTIDKVHETMMNCKRRMTNRAMLRNLTQLAPIIHNETRWSGKYHMLRRFATIREQLLAVADTSGATVTIDRRQVFKRQVEAYVKMLHEIDTNREESGSHWWGCKLRNKHIAIDATTAPNAIFEQGVVKIQRCREAAMTVNEKNACRKLLLENVTDGVGLEGESILNRISENKRRCINKQTKYINCDFIIGSVAEVERLWSIAGNILCDNRMRMTPLLFEALVFLKVNKKYWDLNLVRKAMQNARSDRVQGRIAEENELTGLL
eukprot:IDg12024t1